MRSVLVRTSILMYALSYSGVIGVPVCFPRLTCIQVGPVCNVTDNVFRKIKLECVQWHAAL